MSVWKCSVRVAVSLTAILNAAIAYGEIAKTPSSLVPKTPVDPVAAKAFGAFENRCASCHQTGVAIAMAAGQRLIDILALDRLARTPGMVVPGYPDVSRVYEVMAAGHVGTAVLIDPKDFPSVQQISDVRAWIESLPKDKPVCRESPNDALIERAVRSTLMAAGPEAGRKLRFASLAHLKACTPDADLTIMRDELLDVFRRHQDGGDPGRQMAVSPIDLEETIYVLDLEKAGIADSSWQVLADAYPTGYARLYDQVAAEAGGAARGTYLRADWLAHVLSDPALRQRIVRGEPLAEGEGLPLGDTTPLLVRRYRANLDIMTAAHEFGVTRAVFADRIGDLTGAAELNARRLLFGTISRDEALALYAALTGGAATSPPAAVKGVAQDVVDFDLWPEPKRLIPGELLKFHATSNRACHLTLINIDASGKAVVLFPNDFEQSNVIEAGTVISVPGNDAPYQLRFKGEGPEVIIGVCAQSSTPPFSIAHDFSRFRFTVLPSWKDVEREGLMADREKRRKASQPSRKSGDATPAALAAASAPISGRKAFMLSAD